MWRWGSDVAQTRRYRIGDRITVTHGMTEGRGLLRHDDKPFRVVGILAKTATPVDRVPVNHPQGRRGTMHVDWADGGPPMPGEEIPAQTIKPENLKIDQITGFLLRAKSRVDTLAKAAAGGRYLRR